MNFQMLREIWGRRKYFACEDIEPLPAAKHIFSHVEWHMTGYAVRVEEPEMQPQVQSKKIGTDGLLFVDAEDAKEKYAIPSAFAAYAKYMNILLGSEKNR